MTLHDQIPYNRFGQESLDPARTSKHASVGGFPVPGEQNPSATSVMVQDYFVSNNTWEDMRSHGKFDYIVIGSGFTALAFIDEVLKHDKKKRILCIERGDIWLPTHFQNLPLPFKTVLGGPSETYPWTLSTETFKTKELGFLHGSCPFFGGRSTFWSAYTPQPTQDLMRDFPKSMIDASKEDGFWHSAEKLLNVISADKIRDGIYCEMQNAIDDLLGKRLGQIPTADSVGPAPLAVGPKSPTSIMRFNKFSVPGPLIALHESQRKLAETEQGRPLELMINCTVSGLKKDEGGVVRAIETSRGVLSWTDDDTKVVLCAGAVPNATLLLNSFEECRPSHGNVGKRLTGHVRSNIAARIPREAIHWNGDKSLQLACTYLAGKDPNTHRQYHVGITAIHSPNPEADAEDAGRECPDYAAAATDEQLKGSEKHIVFVLSGLGELDEDNRKNWVKLNNTPDPTSNITVQYTLSPKDKRMWDTMDEAIYKTIEVLSGNQPKVIEYWDDTANKWVEKKPAWESIRAPGVVHEGSTAFVGRKQKGGSCDSLYRPHGIANVFVTGGAVFPTSGSWNPTLTMCAYAQDLARKLVCHPGLIPPSQDFEEPN
ncbi:hypothetical protein TGAM01_v209575 [Trichoderma gamsii]|uniref:Ig-like domain-containing protein n=1 Tax=Trichoderma gamsii TaxID=398673 RepID=A0A2P4ZB73_9HYPO|nr:hypothetical protein TGAM01_v209575 [Trichoderma gamsii]PON21544.1 hypothetical protein TGAM01_v209575 [Trichoderma gamsii]